MDTTALEAYRAKHASYSVYASRLQELVTQLIKRSGIKIHFVESRAKSPESFAEKICRPGKNYLNPMEELPDIIGVRIILYYTDSLMSVGNLLNQKFHVLEEESGHQASAYEADQFGYLSMHYVVTLHTKRKELPEWQDWGNVRAEIQVRTVLQHSWAAVSHALQYKREGDVPLELRRRLHRLAGLFELADQEFVGIRNEAGAITKATQTQLKINPDQVPLHAQSLIHFFNKSAEFKRIRTEAISVGYKFGEPEGWNDDDEDSTDYVAVVVETAHRIGINIVADLKSTLNFDTKPFLQSARGTGDWYVSDPFLTYLLLIKAKPNAFTIKTLKMEGLNPGMAERVLKAAKLQPKVITDNG